MKKISLIALLFFAFTTTAYGASCNYEEQAKLNSEAANVKANYEIKERILDPSEYTVPDSILGTPEEATYVAKTDYIQVNILNMTENMYLEVSNSVNDMVRRYNYSEAINGNITFNWEEIGTLVNYTIKIYTSSNTGCEGNVLKTLRLSLPRYNEYSEYAICDSVPDYYLCQRYVNFEPVEFKEFSQKITKQTEEKQEEEKKQEEENAKWYKRAMNYVKEHKVLFISGGVILITVVGGTTIVVIKRRRRSVI